MAIITTDNATLELSYSVAGTKTELLITDFVSGDIYEISPQNDRTSHINSSNGGVSIQKRGDGGVHNLTIRVQKGSQNDVDLNTALENPNGIAIFSGTSKEIMTRDDGNEVIETWTLENGTIITSPTSTKNDQDGNALSEYVLKFRNAFRTI